MPSRVTKWFTQEEAKNRILQDGEGVRTSITLIDSAVQAGIAATFADAEAAHASRNAHRDMVDSLSTAWQGRDAVSVNRSDREAAMTASIAAAEVTSQRIADSRPDAAASHLAMVEHLNSAWRGQQ